MSSELEAIEVAQLQRYFQNRFGHNGFALKMREKAKDSVEVLLNGEFIGVIYKDTEDGDISYDFNMAILREDLPD